MPLHEDRKKDAEPGLSVVCLDAKSTHVIVPCGVLHINYNSCDLETQRCVPGAGAAGPSIYTITGRERPWPGRPRASLLLLSFYKPIGLHYLQSLVM